MATKSIICDHILVVDDNDIDLFIAEKVLVNSGFKGKITTFKSVSGALSFLGDSLFQNQNSSILILLDIVLPQHDAFYFLEKFDELYAGVELKPNVIICSVGCNPTQNANLMFHKSVIDYIDKPLTFKHISPLLQSKLITGDLINMEIWK